MNTTIELPQGIRFADEASETNYRKAMDGELNEYGFKPLIVINASGPGTGKTRLAHHILEARFGSSAACEMPMREQPWERLIPAVLERGYLFMDNVRGPVNSPTLAALLTSKEWSWRKLGTQKIESAKVDLQVIVAGNGVQLSEDLARRAIWIELA